MRKKFALVLSLSLILTSVIGLSAYAAAGTNSITDTEIYQGIVSYVDEIYPNLKDEEKSKLVDELYKEKSEVSSVAKSKTAVDRNNSEIDVAYENVMAEENYIVGLINGLGENTNLDNWEFNLEYLQNNIDSIKNISDVNLAYVESYMEAYEWVKLNENMPDQKVNENAFNFTTAAEVMATSYSYSDAVSYANKYYKNYNSNYPDWNSAGGDCANFISQCLYAGGKSMKGTPGTKKAADNFANWFSKGTSQNVKNVSSTWRGADAFRNYWQTNASSYKKFTSVNSTSFSYGYKGDAVSLLNSNGRAYHTMIIVGYSSPDFTLAAHTGSTNSAKLSDKANSNGFIIYNMR
ncbi:MULTISPECIES: amidase domain-containing protein [Lacrimispora]|uniref:amidase domain-containing protein n=1 Tax=Lacrimispora TaxID=2719231 RepID=UPI000BE23C0C|nr:amidase domain-containing protein [Lacrimispora amygdalina]MDK2964409.1 hypothetical protein [Lacrimispora sp.]